jgi:hypothetical protein
VPSKPSSWRGGSLHSCDDFHHVWYLDRFSTEAYLRSAKVGLDPRGERGPEPGEPRLDVVAHERTGSIEHLGGVVDVHLGLLEHDDIEEHQRLAQVMVSANPAR